MNEYLTGKRALVFGASSGIGQAVAVALSRSGARVCLTYRSNVKGAETTKSMMEPGTECHIIQADSGKEGEIEGSVAKVSAIMGGLDIAILVAAQFHMAPLLDCDDGQIQSVVRHNVTAPFIFTREVIRLMKDNPSGGKILFVGSSQGNRPLINTSLYAGTKVILPNLCKSICLEHGRDNIQAIVLSPGVTMAAGNIETFSNETIRKEVEAQIPSGKILQPEEFADIAVRLLGEKSGYLTGTEILVDGGLLCAGPQI